MSVYDDLKTGIAHSDLEIPDIGMEALVPLALPEFDDPNLNKDALIEGLMEDDSPYPEMFGYVHGMGMSLITFDWTQIAYIGSPLATPWWAGANVMASFIFFFWFLTPVLYQVYASGVYSISSHGSYDNLGNAYNVMRILNADMTFNEDTYKAYSPLFISTIFAMTYGLLFTLITAMLTHCFLFYRKQIWTQYKQVSEWWYACIFFFMFAFGVITITIWTPNFQCKTTQSHLAVFSFQTSIPFRQYFILALVVSFFYVIPVGMIQAITNQQVGLNMVSELIIGYALPGRPIAMMMFKTWGYITMSQGKSLKHIISSHLFTHGPLALQFTADFKLGHYMKIPPQSMFWVQVIASAITGTSQLAVQAWMFSNIPDICASDQKDGFICPRTQVFGTASIIWGVIGPIRQFSKGQVYYGKFSLLFFFPVGFVCPIIGWLISKCFPNSWIRYLNFPVIFAQTAFIPPASAVNYIPWGIVGFTFQYLIRCHHFSWWTKYNYVLSAALDSGIAITAVLIFFCLQYPKNGCHWRKQYPEMVGKHCVFKH
ncbi:hypothetical protein D9756_011370 [Leucocoprinus leucothites]|uniref:Uncharacterized protein n=1 Tax=Leucocoprinus leucothites TaxID=201217 RepID=A0A8H5FQK4_9AGAR|nr:hypothetical protein D9756_011370 [Leucoagaricus leucothites]